MPVCNICTIKLVTLAYQRAPWFRVVREPLRLAIQALARWHRVDADDYVVRTANCYGCLRFYKTALKERSAAFRWLNSRVNPVFDALIEKIVSPAEIGEAKGYAQAATVVGDASPDLRSKER